MPDIEFYFDFASPNAYLAYRVLPAMAQKAGANIIYKPCLLGGIFKLTNNKAPMIAFAEIKPKLNYERLEFMRFLKRHQLLDFNFNPHFPVTSVLMMRGAVVAEVEGNLDAYIEACMKAMWEDGAKMSEPEVFTAALKQQGLDGDHYTSRANEENVKQALVDKTDEAVARGAFGIPTFYVGKEMFFGKERLDQVIEAAST